MTDLCRKYYVDSINGNDTNDGLSENSAFASLFAVNRLALKPGDHILLACGSVFEKQFLQIRDSGTKQMPIVIGSYGCGEDPLIKTDGQGIWYQDYGKELDSPTHVYHGYVSSAVLLFDAEYIIIQDIEITNSADKVIGVRCLRCGNDFVIRSIQLTKTDILHNGSGEQMGILQYDT